MTTWKRDKEGKIIKSKAYLRAKEAALQAHAAEILSIEESLYYRKLEDEEKEMSLYIKVEMVAGTSIEEAAVELCNLSKDLGCDIQTSFNGIILFVHKRSTSIQSIIDYYHSAITAKSLL